MMKLKLARTGLLGALMLTGSSAFATCDSTLAVYEAAFLANNLAAASQLVSETPECFGAGPNSGHIQISGTSFQQALAISRAVGLRFVSDAPGPRRAGLDIRGMAASNAGKKWNVWGNIENNDTKQRYTNLFNTQTRLDADVLNTVLGIDYTLSPSTILGVSLAFDRGSMSGSDPQVSYLNNADTDGYTLAPYVGIQLAKALILDASLGFGKSKFSTNHRTDGKADRWFGAANLTYEHWMGNVQFSGKASYLRGVEDSESLRSLGVAVAGTAAKNTLGQLRLNAQLGYWVDGVMPYVALGWINDIERKSTQFGATTYPIGRDAWLWSVGVNFISTGSGITGGIAYKQEEGRTNQNNKALTANIGLRF